MVHLSFRVDKVTYDILCQQARKNNCSLSEEVRCVIRKGILFDAPERKSQITLACSIEAVVILRKMAERLVNEKLVDDAYDESVRLMDTIFPE